MKNQWNTIAVKEKKIQDVRNRILNEKLLKLTAKYGKEKGKVFDYGCGWGEYAGLLADKGYRVEAYDDADDMVAQARKRFEKPKFYFKDQFLKNFGKLNKRFDIAVSNLVLCILKRKDQDVLLNNMKKLIKNDGCLIISFCHPCLDYITESVLGRRMRPYGFDLKYDREFKYRKKIHENGIEFDDYHRPLEYYVQLFKKHNLEILDIDESDVMDTEFYPDFIIFTLKKAT